MKFNLPNVVPAPNTNNLVSEYQTYINLYNNLNRTTGPNVQYSIGPLASSGASYSTEDYPDDVDVYGNGQEGMMNLLYKYVLKSYIVDNALINEILEKLARASLIYDVTVTSEDGVLTVVTGLPDELPTSIYDIRFFAPAAAADGDKLVLETGASAIPIVTLDGNTVTDELWAQGSVVQLTITGPNSKATLSGGGAGGGFFVVKQGNPNESQYTENDKRGLWVDGTTSIAYYWNTAESIWKPVVGTFS